ncbi:MAG: uracil-DNA glycosylase [Alphaproteobacteria bacterium]
MRFDQLHIPPFCGLCPRLCAFRRDNALKKPSYHNAPVPSFGDLSARFLIVGLAPGFSGANATGRPFTGDYAGDVLYPALLAYGLALGDYGACVEDTLRLVDTRITNTVRCVPPQNKPTPQEIRTCGTFLAEEIQAMPHLAVILTLGKIAYDTTLTLLGGNPRRNPFSHGAVRTQGRYTVIASYHTSRYNMNTRRLTQAMFDAIMGTVLEKIHDAAAISDV